MNTKNKLNYLHHSIYLQHQHACSFTAILIVSPFCTATSKQDLYNWDLKSMKIDYASSLYFITLYFNLIMTF